MTALIYSRLTNPPLLSKNTPRLATKQAQTLLWSWDSDVFGLGNPKGDPDGDGFVVDTPLRFPGQIFEAYSNLNYNYFRDYDPDKGRYVQSDPIGLEGGLNTYGYAEGNPLLYTDPRGLSSLAGCANPINAVPCAAAGMSPTSGAANTAGMGIWCLLTGTCSANEESAPENCPSNDEGNWEKIPGSNQAYRPKGKKEPIFEKDRAGNRAHGGSAWKKWDKAKDWEQGNSRSGTYDDQGNRLRD